MKKVNYFLLSMVFVVVVFSHSKAQQTPVIYPKSAEQQIVLNIEGVKNNEDLAVIKDHLNKYDGEITLLESNIKSKTLKIKHLRSYSTEDIMQIINRLGYYTYYIDERGKKAVINTRGVIEFWDMKPVSESDN